jgi:hypothetical protein
MAREGLAHQAGVRGIALSGLPLRQRDRIAADGRVNVYTSATPVTPGDVTDDRANRGDKNGQRDQDCHNLTVACARHYSWCADQAWPSKCFL